MVARSWNGGSSSPLATVFTRRYTFAVTRQQNFPFTVFIPIVLLAAALRLVAVDARALWFDEGVSLTFGQMTLPDVLHYHILWQDTNPPVYRIVLGAWTDLVGITAFTARTFSALLGVLAIPLVIRIGQLLRLSPRTRMISAFLLALWPMQVYYSREVKHYTFVQFFLLIGIWLWLRVFPLHSPHIVPGKRKRVGILLAAALCTVLAVGAHYMALLLILTTGVWTVVWAIARFRAGQRLAVILPIMGWGGAQVSAGLALLPWIVATAAGAAAGTRAAAENVGLISQTPDQYLWEMLLEFSAGPIGSFPLRAVAAGLIVGLVLIAITNRAFQTWQRGGILLSWVALPVLFGLAVQSVMPFFYPRFLMFVTPALALIAAIGFQTVLSAARGMSRQVAFMIGIGMFAIMAVLIVHAQARQPDAEPDLRPVAASLNTELNREDALVYSYSWQPGMLAAYLPDSRQPVYYASFFEEGEVGSSLDRILDEHGRIWLLTYTIGADNPINDVGLYLLEHAATPGGVWYGESQLTLFLSRAHAANLDGPEPCSGLSGGRITLCAANVDTHFAPGEPLALKLDWRVSQPIDQRYVVFVHLLAEGHPIPAAQQDVQPVNGLRPSYTWAPGERIEDLHAVTLPMQVGIYRIYAGLYDADTLERVPVDSGGDSVYLGQVEVAAP